MAVEPPKFEHPFGQPAALPMEGSNGEICHDDSIPELPDRPAFGPSALKLLGPPIPDGGAGRLTLLGVLHVENRGEDR
jgi:hypothetical protein